MKNLLHRNIINKNKESFSILKYNEFSIPIHTHKEYELILITKGSGKEFINNSVKEYNKGDLIFIGSNIPHLHLCDSLISNNKAEKSSCILIQFSEDILPKAISELNEFKNIYTLLKESSKGIKFKNASLINTVKNKILNMEKSNGIQRFLLIISILDLLGKSNSVEYISNIEPIIQIYNKDETISRILNYLNKNYNKHFYLTELSELIGQNPNSLCRYFKKHTEKTIFEYLNELRIKNSCMLLINTDYSISQIAFKVGYNNLSHFNNQFKKSTHQTPKEYRKNITHI